MNKLPGNHHVKYPNVPSAIRPIPYVSDLLFPEPYNSMDYSFDSNISDMTFMAGDDVYKPEEYHNPVPLTQTVLKDMTRDLKLSKESAQLLGSCLKERHLLMPGTTFFWSRYCEREFRQFFTFCCIVIMILITIIIQIQAVWTSLFLSTFSPWWHEERDTNHKRRC